MTIRDATAADLAELGPLRRAFADEVPEPPRDDVDIERQRREVTAAVDREVAAVAEDDDGRLVGFALARPAGRRFGRITDLYVAPPARRRGVATLLVRLVVDRLRDLGIDTVRLEVVAGNRTPARSTRAGVSAKRN